MAANNLQPEGGRGRKPRGGAPGRLFAEIAGAAACGATGAASPSRCGCGALGKAQRPGGAGAAESPALQDAAPGPPERHGPVELQEEPAAARCPEAPCLEHLLEAQRAIERPRRARPVVPFFTKNSQSREKATISVLHGTGNLLLTIWGSPSRGQRGRRRSRKGAEDCESGHPLPYCWKISLTGFSTLRLLQLVSSEKGVGKIREGAGRSGRQPRARSSASSTANPGTCAPSHCTEEDPTPGEPRAWSHGQSAPAQRVLTGGTCTRPLHRRLQPRERTAPPNRPLLPGSPGILAQERRGSGYGVLRSWVQDSPFRLVSSPPRIYCLWSLLGWGGSCASATAAAASAAAVASAARKAGGSWGVDALLPPPPALRASPRPLPAETSPAVHLKGTSIMV